MVMIPKIVVTVLRSSSRNVNKPTSIDFLVVNRDKDGYRSDLCNLELLKAMFYLQILKTMWDTFSKKRNWGS